jgi:ATP-dependent Lhr-like helicase
MTTAAPPDATPLDAFHPLVRQWFVERIGTPTDVQAAAWPRIAAGDNVLVTAPTGSGKTLTAFLWAIDRLVSGDWPEGATSVLYISPLKALNNDIRRNLLGPLEELRALFEREGAPFPNVRALTRSGDTPQEERRRMLRQPPEILITTPESLNILLSSQGGRGLLGGLQTVILDEIHAVVATKRGTHLITAVDRLVRLSGEFQRIALSATVRPLERVAEFIGGFRFAGGSAGAAEYEPRPVQVLRSAASKRYDVQVRFPEAAASGEEETGKDSIWPALVADFEQIIDGNRSTLVFSNSRRLCEKITRFLNAERERPLAYAHHGSLSREIREVVESRLKAGELKAIVATNSLEMGIDIGALDEVILVQSPPAVSSAIQRVGRAGHQVGQVSKATLYPTHSHDFLEAAVLAARIDEHDIEEVHPISGPLDVLAQVLVSMTGVETWDLDDLYDEIRTSFPYRHLSRKQFDLVIDMLAGRYAGSRIRELRPRLTVDRMDNSAEARRGALHQLYMSGGTIADRGLFQLRLADSNAVLGELDEEFVWESSEGQSFTLGTQNWTIQRITHNDVFVTPASPKAVDLPFWRGESGNRDFHFSEAIGTFLEEAESGLESPEFRQRLLDAHHMDEVAAEQLLAFLRRQREATGAPLPHRHHLLVEQVSSGPAGHMGRQVVLHTFWGGRVNRPYAMALDAAWEERFGSRLEIYPANDCIVVVLPDDTAADEILALVHEGRVEELLRTRLEASGFFGARFRECAQRALLLTRRSMTERMPLWLSRLRSQKLLDAVMRYEDFPVLVESWRTCLQDEFDMPALHRVLAELETGTIAWTEARTSRPSPFAAAVAFSQVNEYMYMNDESAGRQTSSLRSDLLREVLFSPDLRPTVPAQIAQRFERKRQRLHEGYAPTETRELVDWVDERRLLPAGEWDALAAAVQRDAAEEVDEADPIAASGDRLVRLEADCLPAPLLAARQALPQLAAALPWWEQARCVTLDGEAIDLATVTALSLDAEEGDDGDADPLSLLVGQWLGYYGPVEPATLGALGLTEAQWLPVVDELSQVQTVITGLLVDGATTEQLCDAENFESLLRMARADATPAFETLPVDALPLFLAARHGLHEPGDDSEALRRRMEALLGYGAPAHLWESDILPARTRSYTPGVLDGLLQESVLRWVGCGRERLAFCFEPDLDLLGLDQLVLDGQAACENDAEAEGDTGAKAAADVGALFPDPFGRYDFAALQAASGLDAAALARRLWQGVWQGALTNDSFAALRRGAEQKFELPEQTAPASAAPRRSPDRPSPSRPLLSRRRAAGRAAGGRWRGSTIYPGSWQLLPEVEAPGDRLDEEERNKDRVRLLLDRYGVLFRELTRRELPALRWSRLFRSLRLMELSGEVLAGRFFDGIMGPQFASHRAFRQLTRGLPEDAVWWISAVDPASACGLGLADLQLPRRVASTHLAYRGPRLVFESARNGAVLTFHAEPDDSDLPRILAPLDHLLTRSWRPARQIEVETIQGEPAAGSPYADVLRTLFDVRRDHHNLILLRRT